MDADQIRKLEPMLDEYLERYADCFQRRDTRSHFPVYVRGQLSGLDRKSVEPIALSAGVAVRTLQEFLTFLIWDQNRMRQRLAEMIVREHSHPESIGIIDETGWVKKGDQTPGVQRQYCGAVGKQENCIITVHLGYSAGDFHCLVDGDLFLPESWHADRPRCRKARIPDEVVYRPKSEIALEMYDRARAQGVHLEWLTFDEWYGSKPPFLRALDERDQKFIGEIHKDCRAWIKPPKVATRRYRRRATPRLRAGSSKPQSVEQLARFPAVRRRRWQTWRIKDGQKGPIVWQVKLTLVVVPDAQGLPGRTYHLLVCRNPLTGEIKYFFSNAPPDTPLETLLRVAFSRWRVERCFEDQKGEVGLDHWEGRSWIGLTRHLILSAVSYLFLAKARQALGGEKSGSQRLPDAIRDRCRRPVVAARPEFGRQTVRAHGQLSAILAAPKRDRPQFAHQSDDS